MKRCNRRSKIPLLILIFSIVFLYTPLLMVVIASFNASKYGGAWTHFSFKWYQQLFREGPIWEALVNTLVIAVISTILATILGTLSALALHRARGKFGAIYKVLVQSPLVIPDVLQGISLLLLFVMVFSCCGGWFERVFHCTMGLGFTTIIIAHITFCVSYVAMVVLGRLEEFDNSLIEAAQDLGAGPLYTFNHVTLPVISPGIVAGALFAFTLSIDDFVITFFVKGAGDTTLPIYIQSAMRHGTPAVINALSVIFLVMTFIIVFTTQKLLAQGKEQKK